MSLSPMRATRTVAAVLALALAACSVVGGDAPPTRDVLWRIVDRCLDPASPGYCERCGWPLPGTCGDRSCAATTEVWAATAEFVALRDLKMCGCPAGFVHGLALPRARVTGVEDPRRPAGIWSFAWSAARARIADETEIALVVNPRERRGQDQLHVHLVRLQPGAAARLAALRPEHVERLEAVWYAAERHARVTGTAIRGIVVTRDPRGGFAVVTAGGSPERDFTVARC